MGKTLLPSAILLSGKRFWFFKEYFVNLQPNNLQEGGNMDIINGLAGSRVKSRMLGTKVLIAGKKKYLPNYNRGTVLLLHRHGV